MQKAFPRGHTGPEATLQCLYTVIQFLHVAELDMMLDMLCMQPAACCAAGRKAPRGRAQRCFKLGEARMYWLDSGLQPGGYCGGAAGAGYTTAYRACTEQVGSSSEQFYTCGQEVHGI